MVARAWKACVRPPQACSRGRRACWGRSPAAGCELRRRVGSSGEASAPRATSHQLLRRRLLRPRALAVAWGRGVGPSEGGRRHRGRMGTQGTDGDTEDGQGRRGWTATQGMDGDTGRTGTPSMDGDAEGGRGRRCTAQGSDAGSLPEFSQWTELDTGRECPRDVPTTTSRGSDSAEEAGSPPRPRRGAWRLVTACRGADTLLSVDSRGRCGGRQRAPVSAARGGVPHPTAETMRRPPGSCASRSRTCPSARPRVPEKKTQRQSAPSGPRFGRSSGKQRARRPSRGDVTRLCPRPSPPGSGTGRWDWGLSDLQHPVRATSGHTPSEEPGPAASPPAARTLSLGRVCHFVCRQPRVPRGSLFALRPITTGIKSSTASFTLRSENRSRHERPADGVVLSDLQV